MIITRSESRVIAARGHTRLLEANAAGIAEAGTLLRAGSLVAFPTETVYGLGAHALDARAVRAIFEAKQRPADDPLIVHLAHVNQLESLATPSAVAWRLAERFWPGPLTLVLPRHLVVPSEVTAGLETVALRVPAHPIAHALLEASNVPVAAPSANLFGRPSPTRSEHVLHDLAGRIDAVLEGGQTPLGVESTIIDLAGEQPRLLRPGGLAAEDIEAVLGKRLLAAPTANGPGPAAAPGLLPVHYSPRTPLVLIAGPPRAARARLMEEVERALNRRQRVGVIGLDEDVHALPAGVRVEVVGAWSDPSGSAVRLFDALRALDALELDVLLVRELAEPGVGLGRALADRLRRAAQRVIDSQA